MVVVDAAGHALAGASEQTVVTVVEEEDEDAEEQQLEGEAAAAGGRAAAEEGAEDEAATEAAAARRAELAASLRDYLLAATAKDCGLMVTLQRLEPDEQGGAPVGTVADAAAGTPFVELLHPPAMRVLHDAGSGCRCGACRPRARRR